MRKLLVLLSLIAVSLAFAPGAAATTPSPASGTFTITPGGLAPVRSAGGNLFLAGTQTVSFVGTITSASPTSAAVALVVHPSGNVTFNALVTCTCTVAGLSGTVVFRVEGRGTFPPPTFHGTFETISGTGGLANLHFVLTFTQVGLTGSYSGKFHFDP